MGSNQKPYRIHIIMDPAYGERIRSLPPDEPAWIVDSGINRPVIRSLWQERRGMYSIEGVTSFSFDPDAQPEDWLITELPVIDMHHGEFAHDPPWSILNIVGVRWSERIQQELSGFGFDRWEVTSEGFVTTRRRG